MAKNRNTEIVFILDQSGSMYGLTDDVVGGFNSTVRAQKEEGADALVTTVLFSTSVRTLYDHVPLEEVPELTEYCPGGSTALLDAIGSTVARMEAARKSCPPEEVPARTLVFITTDGLENASRCFDRETVKAMIREKTEKEGWSFVFLAANIDTVSEARSIGISEDRAISYAPSPDGVRECYSRVSMMVRDYLDDDDEGEKKDN